MRKYTEGLAMGTHPGVIHTNIRMLKLQTKSSIKDFVSLVSLHDKGYTVPQTHHPQHSVVLSTATGLWARKVHVGLTQRNQCNKQTKNIITKL